MDRRARNGRSLVARARSCAVVPALVTILLTAGGTTGMADTPQILWSWSFTPAPTWDNVMAVLGGPDVNGDGWADALVASEDYRLRALSGRAAGAPSVLWTFGGTNEIPVSDRAIALYPDRNGDGKPEILFNTGYADRSAYLIDSATGIKFWEHDIRTSGCTVSNPWVYRAVPLKDINRDGVPDVIVSAGSPCNKVLVLNGRDGARLWEYVGLDGVRGVADAGDMTGDGVNEVLATSGANYADNRVFLLDGRISPPTRLIWQHYAGSFVSEATTVHDFTGDGVEEAVAGSWDRTIFAVGGANSGTVPAPLWETSVSGGTGWVEHTIRIPDLDGDCVDDVGVSSWTPTTRILSGQTGTPIWTNTVGGSSNAATAAMVPDITGDMQWDWVVGGLNSGWITLFSGADGTKIWEWAAPANVRAVAWIDDISGDGLPDILAGIQDVATAYAFTGRNTAACVRPGAEVTSLLVARRDAVRLEITWARSTDPCHGRYRIFGVPSSVRGETGCFAQLADITALDEDADPSNESWTGPGTYFGYLVIDETLMGGKGPLGHFRR